MTDVAGGAAPLPDGEPVTPTALRRDAATMPAPKATGARAGPEAAARAARTEPCWRG